MEALNSSDVQNTPPEDSPKSARRRWPFVLVIALVLIIVAVWNMPFLANGPVKWLLVRGAARTNQNIEIGELVMKSWTSIGLDTVSFSGDPELNVAARDVVIKVDPWSMAFGGMPVHEVSIESLAFQVGSPSSPITDFKSLLKPRVESAADDVEPTTPGASLEASKKPKKRRKLELPLFSLKALSGTIHSHREIVIEGGYLTIKLPDDGVIDLSRQLVGELDLLIEQDQPRHITIGGKLTPNGVFKSLSAVSTPSLELALEKAKIALGGLDWDESFISFRALTASFPGKIDLTTDSVTLKFGTEADISWLPKGLPSPLRSFLETNRLEEIIVEDPQLVIGQGQHDQVSQNLRSALVEGPTAAFGPEPASKDLKGRIVSLYERVETRTVRLLGVVQESLTKLPPLRLTVHGALVHFADVPQEASNQDLANISFKGAKEPNGNMQATLRFNAPESKSGTNELVFSSDGEALSLTVRAAHLPLKQYEALFPRSFTPDWDGALKGSDFTIIVQSSEHLSLTGTVEFIDMTAILPAISSAPLTDLNVHFSGIFNWDLAKAEVEAQDAVFGLGLIKSPFTALVRDLKKQPKFTFKATLPRMNAQDALESIPSSILPALEGVRLGGTVAGEASAEVDTGNLASMKLDIRPDVADMKSLSLGKAAGIELLKSHFMHTIHLADQTAINRLVGIDSPDWVPLEDIPKYLIASLTTSEDHEFFRHQGFSIAGIKRSVRVNLERGEFAQGASTISQQLVKNLFLSREKTIARKLQEAFLTWQVEQYLTKDKILELYLNIIEWGPGIWGIRAASQHYFAKDPSRLSLLESAYLVSIIPAPNRYHAHWEAGSVPRAFENRVKQLIKAMQRRGLVSSAETDLALEERIRFTGKPEERQLAPDDDEFHD